MVSTARAPCRALSCIGPLAAAHTDYILETEGVFECLREALATDKCFQSELAAESCACTAVSTPCQRCFILVSHD